MCYKVVLIFLSGLRSHVVLTIGVPLWCFAYRWLAHMSRITTYTALGGWGIWRFTATVGCLLVLEWKKRVSSSDAVVKLRLANSFVFFFRCGEGPIEFCDRRYHAVFGLCPHLSGEWAAQRSSVCVWDEKGALCDITMQFHLILYAHDGWFRIHGGRVVFLKLFYYFSPSVVLLLSFFHHYLFYLLTFVFLWLLVKIILLHYFCHEQSIRVPILCNWVCLARSLMCLFCFTLWFVWV